MKRRIWGLLIVVHKRSLALWRNLFRAQFKVNPDNVLRSHSSTHTLFFLSRQRSQCDVGRRKLKFQIVYNYFSINCHTLHRAQLHKQIQIQSNILLVFFTSRRFWIMEYFSRSISVFGVFMCFFLSEKINYL